MKEINPTKYGKPTPKTPRGALAFAPRSASSPSSNGNRGLKSKVFAPLWNGKAGALQRQPDITGILSLTQLISRIRKQRQQKRQIQPIIPPKSLIIFLKEPKEGTYLQSTEKVTYNRRIIDYKYCGLLQRYIGLGGKILPRRQTRLTAKQQRYIAKTIKSARIMGLLPFVSKEKSFFR